MSCWGIGYMSDNICQNSLKCKGKICASTVHFILVKNKIKYKIIFGKVHDGK